MTIQGPILIHVHIPKTAGTTINTLLAAALSEAKQLYCSLHKDPGVLAAASQFERDEIGFVFGHHPYGLHRLFTRPVCYLACLREPRQRILSLYRYLLAHEDHPLFGAVRRNSHDFSSFLRLAGGISARSGCD